ncbi:MAG: hypothetical protein WC708_00540 [Lentisphaeria bacterium]
MKLIDVCLKIITFGQMKTFMTNFTTTIGYTVYVSSSWEKMTDINKIIILRHERIHMQQRNKYGPLMFSFLYLFFPLPCIFAYFRMKFETEAYAETIKATAELTEIGAALVQSKEYKEKIIKNFTEASYFWTWPFRASLEAWYSRALSAALTKG